MFMVRKAHEDILDTLDPATLLSLEMLDVMPYSRRMASLIFWQFPTHTNYDIQLQKFSSLIYGEIKWSNSEHICTAAEL